MGGLGALAASAITISGTMDPLGRPRADLRHAYPSLSATSLLFALATAACSACAEEPRTLPPQTPPATVPEPEALTIPLRLRLLSPDDPVARAVQQAVRVELQAVGFKVVDGGAQDVELLLTAAASPSTGADTRTAITLSPTVSGHAMEDISGHFARSDQKVDPIIVREVCQRFKRHYQRFRSSLAGVGQ